MSNTNIPFSPIYKHSSVRPLTDDEIYNLASSNNLITNGRVGIVRGNTKTAYIQEDGTIIFSYDRGNSEIILNVLSTGGSEGDEGFTSGFSSLNAAFDWINEREYSNPCIINLPAGEVNLTSPVTINKGLKVEIRGIAAEEYNYATNLTVAYNTGMTSFTLPVPMTGISTNDLVSINQPQMIGAIVIGVTGFESGTEIYYPLLNDKLNATFPNAVASDTVWVYPYASDHHISVPSRLFESGYYVKTSNGNWQRTKAWIFPMLGCWRAYSSSSLGTRSVGGDIRTVYDAHVNGDSDYDISFKYYRHPSSIGCLNNDVNITLDNSELTLTNVVLVGNFVNTGIKAINEAKIILGDHAHLVSFSIGIKVIGSVLRSSLSEALQNSVNGCNYGIVAAARSDINYFGVICGSWKKILPFGNISVVPDNSPFARYEGAGMTISGSIASFAPSNIMTMAKFDELAYAQGSNFQFGLVTCGGRRSIGTNNSSISAVFMMNGPQVWEDGYTDIDVAREIDRYNNNHDVKVYNDIGLFSIGGQASDISISILYNVWSHKITSVGSNIEVAFLTALETPNFFGRFNGGTVYFHQLAAINCLSGITLQNCSMSTIQFQIFQSRYNEAMFLISGELLANIMDIQRISTNINNTFNLLGASTVRIFGNFSAAAITSNAGPLNTIDSKGNVVYVQFDFA